MTLTNPNLHKESHINLHKYTSGFVSICFEQFSAQVLGATKPELSKKAFAVIRQMRNGHKTFLYACSHEALALGIEAGMPFALFQKRFKQIPLIAREEELEIKAREDLSALCYTYSPDFEVRQNNLTIDLSGTPALREQSLDSLCQGLRQVIFSKTGLEYFSLGFAGTRLAAQVLARHARHASKGPQDNRVCNPGEEAQALGPLPPECLPGLSLACKAVFKKYALQSIAQVAQLGRQAIIEHFGQEGERLYGLVSGLDLSSIKKDIAEFEAEVVLERDINDTESLHRVVRLVMDKLLYRLRSSELITDTFTLEIQYADHKSNRRSFYSSQASHAFLPLSNLAINCFTRIYERRVALSLIRIYARRPKRDTGQLDLFWESERSRQDSIAHALNKIRTKHDFNAVLSGSNVNGIIYT